VLLSCKITNTVLTYLEREGEETTSLLQSCPFPEEFLRDPSYWMKAQEMEHFLSQVSRLQLHKNQENILQKIGHATADTRSWGVLDSVLRMMPSPQEVFAQPSRFLSYFISPEPPVDNLVRGESSLAFDLPVPADQFPFVTSYLKASFEALPLFIGKPMVHCQWNGMRLHFDWEVRQSDIFAEKDPGHHISPELLRSIVMQLEQHQHELQKKNAELENRNQQLENQLRETRALERSTPKAVAKNDLLGDQSAELLRMQISRLGDYMVRSQQLITLLIGQNRLQPSVKEAMKRVDWEYVKEQFPLTMASCETVINQSIKTEEETHVGNHCH
jgi:hypothetical protein